jgi:hypothetical protein
VPNLHDTGVSVKQLWSAVWLLLPFAQQDRKRWFVWVHIHSFDRCRDFKKGPQSLAPFMHVASPLYPLACSHPRQRLSSDHVIAVPPDTKIPPDDHRLLPEYSLGKFRVCRRTLLLVNVEEETTSAISIVKPT